MNITFIGGGNMASAIIGGLLRQKWAAAALRVVEIDPDARARLESRFGINTFADAGPGIADSDCVLIAVKPQQLRGAARALSEHVASRLVITIAAGIRCIDLSRWLGGHQRIVRVMPNTPALALAGISGLYAMPPVTAEDRAQVEKILGAVGLTLWLEREEQMDAVTAVSGSGPAYVFYFIEALQQAAVELGFTAEEARLLAHHTFSGAIALAGQSAEDAAALRLRVTSKGGTTERALNSMETDRVKAAIVRAVQAAAKRSRELGDEFGRD